MRKMWIKRPYYDAIMAGRKTLEVRVGYNSIRRLEIGELLQLETSQQSGVVQIKSIRVYDNFSDMIAAEPWRDIIPQANSEAHAVEFLRRIYPADKERLGVYVIELSRQ